MLPEPLRVLIAAYAADDLTPRRRRAAQRLLKHSDEARALLVGLQSDAQLLSELPKHSAPRDLERRVLSRLPSPAKSERQVWQRPPRWPTVVGTLVAASVVLAVSIGGWSLISYTKPTTPGEQPVVKIDPAPTNNSLTVHVPTNTDAKSHAIPQPIVPSNAPVAAKEPDPPKSVVASAPATTGSELASPPRESPEPIQIHLPRLPEIFGASSLQDPATLEQLVGELARADTHRIDLFCRDGGKALERLHAAMRQRGIRTLSDSLVSEMQKRKLRGSFVVYTDALNAAEWGQLLKAVELADRNAEIKKPGEGVLDQLVLMPFGPSDQKELTALMGQEPTHPSVKPNGPDPRRPLSDDTADQVAMSISKSDVGKGARLSIAMATAPARTLPASSIEIRQFHDSRRPRIPGTISVMLVIRYAG